MRRLIFSEFLILAMLFSCAPLPDNTALKSQLPNSSEATLTESVQASKTGQPAIPTSSTPFLTNTDSTNINKPSENTPIPTYTPILLWGYQSGCPKMVSNNKGAIINNGSLLFSISGTSTQDGIWIISEDEAKPRLLLEQNKSTGIIFETQLSPDGKRLAWPIHNFEREYPLLGIYDLAKGEFQAIDVGVSWERLLGFSDDQRITLQQKSDILPNEFYRSNILYDPITMKFESSDEVIKLPPNPYEDDSMHRRSTFSYHPNGNYVIYTAENEKGVNIVLYDLNKQNSIWEFHQAHRMPLPVPAWSHDGKKAALSIWSEEGSNMAARILILNLEGISSRLIPQFYLGDYDVQELSWSPDDHYLFFSLGHAPVLDGNGYILNIRTNELSVICDPFMAKFYGGQWIGPENQFVYGINSNDDQEELRILDIESWEWQRIVTIDKGSSVFPFIIHGWTPILVSK